MSIQDVARQGLSEGSKLRWRFWKREEINNQAMDQVLLSIGQEAEPRLATTVEYARQLARQSPNAEEIYQRTLTAVAEQVCADLAPMAGLALGLWQTSGASAEVKEELGQTYLGQIDGGRMAALPAPPDKVLGLLSQPPQTARELAAGLQPLLCEQNSQPVLELLREKAPDWVALHERLPLKGEPLLQAERALLGAAGSGPAPGDSAWALELCGKGLDLARWGLERNRTAASPWHQWYDEWGQRRPLEMLKGSLTGVAPTLAERTSLTSQELETGAPGELLEWLNRTAFSPQSELASALLNLPLADETARIGLLQTALDQGELADSVHTLRDKLRMLHGTFALADGPFEGVREKLLELPWQEQAVSLWAALGQMRALENPQPVQLARCLADSLPGLDELLWRNLGKSTPVLAEWAEKTIASGMDRREAWSQLEELCGSLAFQVTARENQALVREESGFVDIGPVRLVKRDSGDRSGAQLELSESSDPAVGPARSERFLTAALDPRLDACPADQCRGSVGQGLFQKAREAGRKMEGGQSSKNRAVYTIAAAVAGERAGEILAEARAGEGGQSSRKRSLYALAAAHSNSPEQSREIFKLARELEGGSSSEIRGAWAQAVALAGTPERARHLKTIARQIEGGQSARKRATYAIACAIAGSYDAARAAYSKARALEGGYSSEKRSIYCIGTAIAGARSDLAYAEAWAYEGGHSSKNRSLYFVAAAIAGSPEMSRQAFQLAREAEGGYSSENRAYYAIAAAAALNPSKRHLAAAVFYEEER